MVKLTGGPLIGVISYVIAQGLNLLLQFVVIAKYGTALYAKVGLAQVAVMTIVFLGELGYSIYFVREVQLSSNWKEEWRYAQGHRLIVLLVGAITVYVYWYFRYGLQDEGTRYLLCSLPGVILTLYNFSPLFLAQGRYRIGFLGMPLVWAISLSFYGITSLNAVGGSDVGIRLGIGLTLGFLSQALFYILFCRDSCLIGIRFGRTGNVLLINSLRLWALSLLGTLNERLTPFLLEAVALNFLPFYLVISQVLQGASGVLGQINRVLLREQSKSTVIAKENSSSCSHPEKKLLIWAIALGTLLACLAGGIVALKHVEIVDRDTVVRLGFLTVFVWLTTALGSLEGTTLIAQRHEKFLFSIMMKCVAISIVFQVVGSVMRSPDLIFWAKVVTGILTLYLCYRKLNSFPNLLVLMTIVALTLVWCSLVVGSFGMLQISFLTFIVIVTFIANWKQNIRFLAHSLRS